MTILVKFLALILTSLLLGCSVETQASVVMPLEGEVSVMNTISTPQFYGPVAVGFHHGLDLKADAGTPVYAPVSGVISMRNYYPRKPSNYTYEIAIQTNSGDRWELHHIDPDTIPDELRELADSGEYVLAGTFLGNIFDASSLNIFPHLHINVIDSEGYFLSPQTFLPPIPDDAEPIIRGHYLVDETGEIATKPSADSYTLVLDIADQIPPSDILQTIYSLKVETQANEAQTTWSQSFPRLPVAKTFFEGIEETFYLQPIDLPDGTQLKNQVNSKAPRRFLYGIPVTLHPGNNEVTITASDFAGNNQVKALTIVAD